MCEMATVNRRYYRLLNQVEKCWLQQENFAWDDFQGHRAFWENDGMMEIHSPRSFVVFYIYWRNIDVHTFAHITYPIYQSKNRRKTSPCLMKIIMRFCIILFCWYMAYTTPEESWYTGSHFTIWNIHLSILINIKPMHLWILAEARTNYIIERSQFATTKNKLLIHWCSHDTIWTPMPRCTQRFNVDHKEF